MTPADAPPSWREVKRDCRGYQPADVIRAGGWSRFLRTIGTMMLGVVALWMLWSVAP